MKVTQVNIFASPITIAALETRFKNAWKLLFDVFEGSCCIDTQPPLPPGVGY